MPSLPALQIGSAGKPAAGPAYTLLERQIQITLVLLAALMLSLLAWSTWDGIRAQRAHQDALASQAALLAAVQLSERLAAAHRILDEKLAAQRERLAAAVADPGKDKIVGLLRRLLPRLVAVEIDPVAVTQPPGSSDIGLRNDGGQPRLVYRTSLTGTDGDGYRLTLVLPCGDLCIDRAPRSLGLRVHLVGGGSRWTLSERAAGPAETGAAGAWVPRESIVAGQKGAIDPTGIVAHTGLPGIAGWRLEASPGPARLGTYIRNRLLMAAALAVVVVLATNALSRRVRQQSRRAIGEHRQLETSRRKLAAILDSTTDGIILVDEAGTIELLNPAAEVMFGQLGEDVVGSSLDDLLPELDDARRPGEIAGDNGLHVPVMRELQARRSDGGRFPARVWLRPLALDDGPRLLLVAQDLTETAQNAQQLTFLEQHDVLTGLLNRKEFARRMQRHLADAAGSGTPHVLCYIDIDQFKVINDTVGHAAGDALVEQLATLIAAKFDDAALLARLGGDEFGALFVDCSERDALDRAEGLMQTVRNFLFTWRDRSFDVAVSIGVTAFQPENDSAAAELAKADVACHMAKHDGRDRIHVYRDGDTSVIRHHGNMHLVSTISQALSCGRFRLYSQPIVPLGDGPGREPHHEVLVRMLDEHGETIHPDHFIPAAEQYVLMPAVDRWIIHELFSSRTQLLRAWHDVHPEQFLFAVNLSGTSVTDDSFLPYLRRQFEVHGVPPAAICFEITETAAMRNLDTARNFMQQVAGMGASFALDDFGTGLSSYNYLRELPVSYLKIDGSFVRDMNVNPVNHALVASINQVAHVLGLKTIAEWAEDASTIDRLRALGVDYVQGYALGIPRPVNELQVNLPPAAAGDDAIP